MNMILLIRKIFFINHLLIIFIIFSSGCTEHYNLEQENGRNRVDFTETIRISDKPIEVHILFQPQINSGRYLFGLKFPEFDYKPSNHAMADTTQWFHLVNGMSLSIFDENNNLLAHRDYDTFANRMRGWGYSPENKTYGTSIGSIYGYNFKSNRIYRFVISFPGIDDPFNKFQAVTFRATVLEPKFKFEVYL